jgi:hypothetical protein
MVSTMSSMLASRLWIAASLVGNPVQNSDGQSGLGQDPQLTEGAVGCSGSGSGSGPGEAPKKIVARRFSASVPNSIVSPCMKVVIIPAGIPLLPSVGDSSSAATLCARAHERDRLEAPVPGVLA